MSKKVRFELNRAGVRAFLQSEPVKGVCEEYANAVASRADGNYEVSTIKAGTRYIATVKAADAATRQDNLKNNTLLKAIGGGS